MKNKITFGLLIILAVFLVSGINGCGDTARLIPTGPIGIPGPPEKGAIDLGKLPQLDKMSIQRYEGVINFTLYSPKCVNLLYSGPAEDKMDIVFLAEDYSSMGKFYEDVEMYIDFEGEKNGILGIEPFKSNIDKFNFYLIDKPNDLKCKLGCFGLDRLVCCNDNKVKQIASQCPYDQIIVLVDTREFCGAAKDYATVCTINDNRAGMVLVHELGHTVGKLGDEYSYGEEGDTDVPNCDSAGCEKWAGTPGTDCFKTCGYTNLYRPTARDSLMYRYVPQFGPIATQEFLDVFDNFESGEPVREIRPAIQLSRSYVIELKSKDGQVKLQNLYVTNASFEEPLDEVDYVGKIKSFDDKSLAMFKINLPEIIYPFYAPDATEAEKKHTIAFEQKEIDYTFNAPYFYNGNILEIYNQEGRIVDSISLAPFAETCGDGICQEQEDYLECSNDCPITLSDEICVPYEDNKCDPDCPKFGTMFDSDCKGSRVVLIVVITSVLIGLFLLILIQKLREEHMI